MLMVLISISFSDSNCRFCLRKFKENEKQVEINNYLRRQFSLITQTELKSSKVYSENVCEACFNAVRDSMTLRKKLLENQKTLEKAFGDFEDVKKESDSKKLDREISLDEKIIESVDVDKSWNENVAVKSEVLSDDEEKVPSISGLTVKNEDESHFEDFELMSKEY